MSNPKCREFGSGQLAALRNVRESLASLEHEQWAHWTAYMLDNMTPENIERWRRQLATPYAELTPKEQDSDREWANKVLAVMLEYTQPLYAQLAELEEVTEAVAECAQCVRDVRAARRAKKGEQQSE